MTRDLGFSGLIRKTALFSRLLRHTRGCGESILNPDPHGSPISRLLRHTWGCGGPILTRILTGTAKYKHMLGAEERFSREGCLSCHTYCDTEPRFFRSHPKDHPTQSPLTTRMGTRRTYSNPDPHGVIQLSKLFDRNKCLWTKYN